jgi:hypothetical protein
LRCLIVLLAVTAGRARDVLVLPVTEHEDLIRTPEVPWPAGMIVKGCVIARGEVVVDVNYGVRDYKERIS